MDEVKKRARVGGNNNHRLCALHSQSGPATSAHHLPGYQQITVYSRPFPIGQKMNSLPTVVALWCHKPSSRKNSGICVGPDCAIPQSKLQEMTFYEENFTKISSRWFPHEVPSGAFRSPASQCHLLRGPQSPQQLWPLVVPQLGKFCSAHAISVYEHAYSISLMYCFSGMPSIRLLQWVSAHWDIVYPFNKKNFLV